ncbi:hypothetical protein MBGDF03_00399 [Thermoplasmatales archaeon SCGC AB-540-F20]|nr:hypothetical protein MBGDF03_00399 [Thermoplasmatales archaeon SCGC AB-540-F20]
MNGKIMIIGIAVMFLVVGLSGCEEVDSRFVGLWAPQTMEYPAFTFFSNKTYSIPGINGTWDIKDDILVLEYDGLSETYNFVFSEENTKLTLTGVDEGVPRVYFKQ